MSNIRISIAMGTYNGERYLESQLQSLASQTFEPYELVVCDDGSTDATLEILEKFSTSSKFPVRIYRNEKTIGFSDNFLKAASLCEGNWVAFCDQDDVWLPDKLSCAMEVISTNNFVNLILQNAYICDSKLEHNNRMFPDSLKPGFYDAQEIYGHWVWLGFLQTVRADLIRKVGFDRRPVNRFRHHPVFSHDMWTCYLANALGGICVLERPIALYRRHDQAVTGSYGRSGLFKRVQGLFATGYEHYKNLSKAAVSCAEVMSDLSATTEDRDWSIKFRENAVQFYCLAELLQVHSRLYKSKILRDRIRCYLYLWKNGAYVGPPFSSVGFKVAIKDLILAVLGVRKWVFLKLFFP